MDKILRIWIDFRRMYSRSCNVGFSLLFYFRGSPCELLTTGTFVSDKGDVEETGTVASAAAEGLVKVIFVDDPTYRTSVAQGPY